MSSASKLKRKNASDGDSLSKRKMTMSGDESDDGGSDLPEG